MSLVHILHVPSVPNLSREHALATYVEAGAPN